MVLSLYAFEPLMQDEMTAFLSIRLLIPLVFAAQPANLDLIAGLPAPGADFERVNTVTCFPPFTAISMPAGGKLETSA